MVARDSISNFSGLDDPQHSWLQRTVRVKAHPEWGLARATRWYPRSETQPVRLRIKAEKLVAQQVVTIDEVELVEG